MSNKYNKLLTILFCGFLALVLGVSTVLPDKDFSELENRNLSKLPELSWETLKNGDFMGIGIPFTLAAVIPAYIFIWVFFG